MTPSKASFADVHPHVKLKDFLGMAGSRRVDGRAQAA